MTQSLIKKASLLLSTILLLAASSARAASGESITGFNSQVAVKPDGSAQIFETIDYDFGGGSRHGIFRYIPYKFTDDQGQHLQTVLTVMETDLDGAKVSSSQSADSGDQVIKIGDPGKTITGLHRYRLSYSLKPIVLSQPDGDLLRLNITGNGWDVPINSVSTTITAQSSTPTAATCYTGIAGSTDKNCLYNSVPGGYQISAQALSAGQNLTAEVVWPKGSFASYLAPGQLNLSVWEWATIFMSAIGILLMLVALLWLGQKKLAARRLKSSQTVVAQYEPPDGLKPAELGYISDDKINLIEVTATLVDLAVRGYIKITQTTPRSWSGLKPAQYSFNRIKDGTDLKDYEEVLFAALFSSGSPVSLQGLDRTAMAAAVTKLKSAVADQLKTKGYYRQPLSKSNRTLISTGGFFGLLFVLGLSQFSLVGPILIILGLAANYLVAKSTTTTGLGAAEWAKVQGFKLFLNVTEADRLKFSDAPNKTPELFSKLLPYAIALKVEQQWAKQFQGIDITPSANGWYVGPNSANFNAGFLAGDLSGSFASAVSTNFTPANTSSSGFGGGFSGGGFGGGGGGSW